MAQQTIDIGVLGNDGTGESIREAFKKVNENFSEVYAVYGINGSIDFTRLSDAPASYARNQIIMGSNTQNNKLTARTIQSGDNSIIITTTNNAILDLVVSPTAITTHVGSDPSPYLSAPLNADLLPIGKLPDPSNAIVDEYNAIWGPIGAAHNTDYTTTIKQLPVTVNYGINNYVAGIAADFVSGTPTTYVVPKILKSRAEPGAPETQNADYDATLTGNYLKTEIVQRQHLVYRGGDTMTGLLKLSGNPTDALHATPKQYVDDNFLAKTPFTSGSGALVVNNGTFSVTPITTTGAVSSLVKTDTSGDITANAFHGNLIATSVSSGSTTTPGTITGYWSLGTGSRMSATYADVAEYYEGDKIYEPGTVLIFGGENEVTISTIVNDTRIAGVVTTNPAYVLNENQSGDKVCIALVGRIPCKIIGRVKKGDLLTTSNTPGCAIVALNPKLGSIIGKSLENKDTGEIGIIEIAVGRA